MSIYKVIGVSGRDAYLLVDKRASKPKHGRVLANSELFQPLTIQAIIGRGYWENGSLPDAELDELLAAAFEVPVGAAVPIPPRATREKTK